MTPTTEEEQSPRLLWHEQTHGGGSYHAVLYMTQYVRGAYIPYHRHDFYEFMYVVTGTGTHRLLQGDTVIYTPIRAGTLLFIRPNDCHSFSGNPGKRMQWFNISFAVDAWESFRIAADLPSYWETQSEPPCADLAPGETRTLCASSCEEAVQRFHTGMSVQGKPPGRLALCRFLVSIVDCLLSEAEPAKNVVTDAGPPWLARACRAFLEKNEHLVDGVPRLVSLAGVSYTHLARTLKAISGKSPTQYVNDLRIARAALLLTTTAFPIVDIAADCGFTQLSYFYRLFREQFNCAPDTYRRAAQELSTPMRLKK